MIPIDLMNDIGNLTLAIIKKDYFCSFSSKAHLFNESYKKWWTCSKVQPLSHQRAAKACADPGIFVRGVQVSLTKKNLTMTPFFSPFFQSSAYFTEVKWSISKKSIILHGSRGGPTFSRGSNFFQGGGVQLLIPYRNPYNL